MTAGLPGTPRVGSTLHRRILASILVSAIAVAPARAYEAFPLVLDTTPASVEIAFDSDASETLSDSADDAVPDARADTPASDPEVLGTAEPMAEPAAEPAAAPSIDQVIYKGVVGNLLEAVPLDPEQRVQLQRGNAILNNAFTGRSVALLLGIASPPLMIVGLIWGIWSAVNIKAAPPEIRTAVAPLAQPEIKTGQPASDGVPGAAASSDDQPVRDSSQVAAQAGE
jgi:hypothetical protein